MTRIAPYAQQRLIMFNTLRTQERLYDAQIQIATGQRTQTFAGISAQTNRLLSVEASFTRDTQYIRNIETAERRVRLADMNLDGVEDIARELQDLLDTAVDAPSFNHLSVRQYAINAKALLSELMNARDGDRYLFSGERVDRRAVDMISASYTPISLVASDGVTVDPAFYADYRANVLGSAGYPQGSFYEQIYFDKNGVAPPAVGQPADLDDPTLSDFVGQDPDLWSYYVSRLNSTQMLANPKLDYYGGDATSTSVQITKTTRVNYGVRADEPSIQQLLTGLDALANLPEVAPADTYLGSVFSTVKEMLGPILNPDPTTVLKTVSELRLQLNGPINLFRDTRERHTEYINYAQTVVADIEQIDPAEVIARLQSDQVTLEASFTALSRVQQLSLVDYLR